MSTETIDYPALVEEALLTVVQEVLESAAVEGLPGEHHFFLTFATREDGVEIPAFLAQRYPEEMTIILQHRFWDLEVEEGSFAVTLSFQGQRHRLTVPLAALRAFADPAAGFGLRFGTPEEISEETAPTESPEGQVEANREPEPPGKVVSIDRFRKKPGA